MTTSTSTDLAVRVRNDLASGVSRVSGAGSGAGLIGLRERVELAGGTLVHGPTDRGEFVVEARVPWA